MFYESSISHILLIAKYSRNVFDVLICSLLFQFFVTFQFWFWRFSHWTLIKKFHLYVYTHMDALCWKWILSLWIWPRQKFFICVSLVHAFQFYSSLEKGLPYIFRVGSGQVNSGVYIKLKNFYYTVVSVVSVQTWQTTALWPKCLTMLLNINWYSAQLVTGYTGTWWRYSEHESRREASTVHTWISKLPFWQFKLDSPKIIRWFMNMIKTNFHIKSNFFS